jgi:hypothetical protein
VCRAALSRNELQRADQAEQLAEQQAQMVLQQEQLTVLQDYMTQQLAEKQEQLILLQDNMAQQLAESDKAVALKDRELAETRAELSNTHNELQQSYAELTQLSLLLRQQQEVSAVAQTQLHAELNKTRKQVNQLQTSQSWKLTAPLRAITSIFGKNDEMTKQFRKEQDAIVESGLFDENWYLTQYPDLAQAGVEPLLHYLKFGGFEGRKPNPDFDSAFYLAQYPDVVKGGLNPLVHYVRFGRSEQRLTSANMLEESL